MNAAWLRADEFLPHAPNRVGAQTSVNHADCPAGADRKRRLYVRRVARGVLAYCHHCGAKGANFGVSGEAAWEALAAHAVDFERAVDTDARKREDAERWVAYYLDSADYEQLATPDDARAWLRAKGFSHPTLAGVLWGAPEGEEPGLMLPIRAPGGRVVGVQIRRYFGELRTARGPKYETKLVEKTDPHVYGDEWCDVVVLVEDYLSALRVSKFIPAVPLYGNTCSDSVLGWLQPGAHPTLAVWMDNDKPEIADAARTIATRAAPLFDRVECVITACEPTKYTDAEIRSILDAWGLL